jgi:exosortase/archaeosortase family protein
MNRRGQLRFAMSFAAIAGTLFVVYCFPYAENGISERLFSSYLDGYARAAGSVLRVFEPQIVVQGNNILGRFSMTIIKSCDAMEANILFCAAILAFPAPWGRKGIAALAGLGALVAANVARLCCLYYVGIYLPSSFEFMHVDVWPLLMMVVASTDFILWVHWMRKEEAGATRPLSPAPEGRGAL